MYSAFYNGKTTPSGHVRYYLLQWNNKYDYMAVNGASPQTQHNQYMISMHLTGEEDIFLL